MFHRCTVPDRSDQSIASCMPLPYRHSELLMSPARFNAFPAFVGFSGALGGPRRLLPGLGRRWTVGAGGAGAEVRECRARALGLRPPVAPSGLRPLLCSATRIGNPGNRHEAGVACRSRARTSPRASTGLLRATASLREPSASLLIGLKELSDYDYLTACLTLVVNAVYWLLRNRSLASHVVVRALHAVL